MTSGWHNGHSLHVKSFINYSKVVEYIHTNIKPYKARFTARGQLVAPWYTVFLSTRNMSSTSYVPATKIRVLLFSHKEANHCQWITYEDKKYQY
jgi:hypothetical protein